LIIGSYFVLFLPSEQSHLSCSRAAVKVFILNRHPRCNGFLYFHQTSTFFSLLVIVDDEISARGAYVKNNFTGGSLFGSSG